MYIITYACNRIHGQGARVTQGAPGSSRQNSIIPIVTFLHAYPLELLPPQSDFQGKIFLRKNFHPFSGLDGGSSRHFYTHLNALKTARIESREDSKTHSVAKIGENGVFFVKVLAVNP